MAAAVVLLALVEAANALIAPLRAPSDADWASASNAVRAGFQPGDLIVAAPAWSDQVMRLHVGDLLPVEAAARLDSARFGRVWEISQRGASSGERRDRIAQDSRHGALRVRLLERHAPRVTYDFAANAASARVFRVEGGRDVPCAVSGVSHSCRGGGTMRPRLLEVDFSIRRGFLVPPEAGAVIAVEFPDVSLGAELAVGSGLHSVWVRRGSDATATLRVLVNGQALREQVSSNRSGWQVRRLDTTKFAGTRGTVRFEVSSPAPPHRLLGFNAEARGP